MSIIRTTDLVSGAERAVAVIDRLGIREAEIALFGIGLRFDADNAVVCGATLHLSESGFLRVFAGQSVFRVGGPSGRYWAECGDVRVEAYLLDSHGASTVQHIVQIPAGGTVTPCSDLSVSA